MTITLPAHLGAAEVDEFGREMDAIYDETMASLGADDERYVRRLIRAQRTLALGSRLLMLVAVAFHPRFPWDHGLANRTVFWALLALGAVGLGVAKIIENMEIGHNVMHGQWDWMNDPQVNSTVWEWDNVCPSDQWKHSHNVVHHTWTNVLGKDRDVGYEIMRLSELQRWHPAHLLQPVVNVLLMLLFEWGVGAHDFDISKHRKGTPAEKAEQRAILRGFRRKALRQVAKDYVLWPLLAGPFFLYVLGANLVANLIRNVWSNIIIFCGHFPDDVAVFTKADVEGESRSQWYVRQLLGSANIKGGKLMHLMSGNLSFQIEHHLFPDMPSNRYHEVAPRVQAMCQRYGLPYNTHRLSRQYGTATLKIWRLALPGGHFQPDTASPTAAAA